MPSVNRARFWKRISLAAFAAAVVSFLAVGSAPSFFVEVVRAAAVPIERRLQVDRLDRRFLVYLPVGYQQKGPLSVLLAFHGASQAAEGLADLAAIQNARLAANFVIVYPEGYERRWNINGLCCGAAAKANVDDVKFARAILDDLATFVRIDRRRVYATGYSNGGGLSYHLACVMSDAIAAIAPMSGNMWDSKAQCHPLHPMPVYAWHGMKDKIVPYGGGLTAAKEAPPMASVPQDIEFWAKFDKTTEAKRVALFNGNADCDLFYGGTDDARVTSCRVPAMGHRWPGSRPTARSLRADAVFTLFAGSLGPYGPVMNVNDDMLSFLSAYSLPAEMKR
jgi:polyhydroxybutyrate depolymerase